jgi:polysaccharide pyruvyl transferase WcaK-like protein
MVVSKAVVLLDLWTDANRGDCALQIGLLAMARAKWPGHEIVGVFRFGTNEMALAADEVSYTSAQLDRVFGGLRRTYYSARNFGRLGPRAAKLLALYSFFELTSLLLLYKIGMRRLVPRAKREVMDVIAKADLVIWKGKNFRDYGGLAGINRQLTLLSAGVVASFLNRNIHCVNASVWQMRGTAERRLVRWAFSRCRSISVREPQSLLAIEQLQLPAIPVRFAQDLSFYCLQSQYAASGAKRTAGAPIHDVALTITQWGSSASQQAYLTTLRECVRSLIAHGARRFVVVPQVTRAAEDSSQLVAALHDCFPNDAAASLTVLPGSPDIGALLDTYERTKLLVGTRMHSCVFALSVATPFVAIAYDAGPKWDILKEFWPARFMFEYGSACDQVARAAVEAYQQGASIVAVAGERFAALAEQSFDNVRYL